MVGGITIEVCVVWRCHQLSLPGLVLRGIAARLVLIVGHKQRLFKASPGFVRTWQTKAQLLRPLFETAHQNAGPAEPFEPTRRTGMARQAEERGAAGDFESGMLKQIIEPCGVAIEAFGRSGQPMFVIERFGADSNR